MSGCEGRRLAGATQDANSDSLAHAPRERGASVSGCRGRLSLVELRMQTRFHSHSTEQLVGRISVVVCDVERASAVAAKAEGTRRQVIRRDACGGFVVTTNPFRSFQGHCLQSPSEAACGLPQRLVALRSDRTCSLHCLANLAHHNDTL